MLPNRRRRPSPAAPHGRQPPTAEQLEPRYDEYYPVVSTDWRICNYRHPITGRACKRRFREWSMSQSNEPWVECWYCADQYPLLKPKKKRKQYTRG